MSSAFNKDYEGLWRAAANEAVAYSEDFPEPILVYPELPDNSINADATIIITEIDISNPEKCTFIHSDNGKGVKSSNRLLDWTSSESSNITNVYGHGLKKCLSKWMPDYKTADWKMLNRYKDPRGNGLNCLTTYIAPFCGRDTKYVEDMNDEDLETLTPSGFSVRFNFNLKVLMDCNTKDKLYQAIKEILTTRYSHKIFKNVEFVIIIKDKFGEINKSSKKDKWICFEDALIKQCEKDNATKTYDLKFNVGECQCDYRQYYLKIDGRQNNDLKEAFPKLGSKNQKSSRVHISLGTEKGNRIVECMPYYNFIGREQNHNDFNGCFAFLNFSGPLEFLPKPCTTKVKFKDDDDMLVSIIKETNKLKNKADTEFRLAQEELKRQQEKTRQELEAKRQEELKRQRELKRQQELEAKRQEESKLKELEAKLQEEAKSQELEAKLQEEITTYLQEYKQQENLLEVKQPEIKEIEALKLEALKLEAPKLEVKKSKLKQTIEKKKDNSEIKKNLIHASQTLLKLSNDDEKLDNIKSKYIIQLQTLLEKIISK